MRYLLQTLSFSGPAPFSGAGKPRALLCCALLAAAVMFTGCAARTSCMESTLAAVHTMQDARYRFGAPKSSTTQPDGTVRYEWLLDVSYHQAGRYVTEPSPWVRHDSDGYRIETEREVYKRPKQVTKFCRLVVVADAGGRVLSSHYEGEDCCDIIMRPVSGGGAQ